MAFTSSPDGHESAFHGLDLLSHLQVQRREVWGVRHDGSRTWRPHPDCWLVVRLHSLTFAIVDDTEKSNLAQHVFYCRRQSLHHTGVTQTVCSGYDAGTTAAC